MNKKYIVKLTEPEREGAGDAGEPWSGGSPKSQAGLDFAPG